MDWSSLATQELRFLQLLKVCELDAPLSLNDVGCGYGALLAYLRAHHANVEVDYLGIDLSPAMIGQARRLWKDRPGTRFLAGHRSPRAADYSVASGIFNVKLATGRQHWEAFVRKSLEEIAGTSLRGFAVNFLAPEPAHLPQAPQLYRTPPQPWLRFCEEELKSRVAVVAGYGLSEFTLLARF